MPFQEILVGMECPHCNTPNPSDSKFCRECATPLPSSPQIPNSQIKTIFIPYTDFSADTLFAGRYRIIEKIGRGGMGIVYKAEDTKLKRTVALKFIPPELIHIPEIKERFLREAQAAAALDHTNICAVYEIDESEGRAFISMPFIEGMTLKEKISNGPLQLVEAMNIACQIADGLKAAHRKGIIHRDIKSANIMVDKEGLVKIMDFGLARLPGLAQVTQSGVVMGTVAYMSPEQTQGHTLDYRTDIWSLGIVIYEMLSGSLPFLADNHQTQIFQILNTDPRPILDLRDDLPPNLDHVIRRTLAKNPENRYQSAHELKTDLQKLHREKVSQASEPEASRPDRVLSKRRFPKRSFFFSAAALVMILIIFFGIKNIIRPPQSSPEPRRSIAVMYFENLSDDRNLDWMQKGIVELMNTDLSQSRELYVLDSQRLFDILKETGKTGFDQASATEVAEIANIKILILGNIIKAGEKIRLQARVVDRDSGNILLADYSEGESESDIFTMVSELTGKMRSFLEIKSAESRLDEDWLRDITTDSVEAFRYFVEGKEFLYQSRWQDAIQLFEKAVETDLDFGAAYVFLASSYWNFEDYQSMDSAFNNALRLRDRVSHKERLMIDIFGATKNNDHELEIVLAQEILQYDPQSNFWSYILGRGYYFNNQLDKAVETWGRIADRNWNWVWLYYYLGSAYSQLGRFDAATEVFLKGVEASPRSVFLYGEISVVLALKGDRENSDLYYNTFLTKAREVKDNPEETYEWVGNSYLSAELFDRALDCFKQGLIRTPRVTALYFGLGRASFALEDDEAAKASFEQVVNADPEAYRAFFHLGLIHEKLGDWQKAAEAFSKVVVLAEEGQEFEEARAHLQKLKKIGTI